MENEIHTIELNLDDDFASSCAYHVDDLKTTIRRNIEHAETYQQTQRWVLVGMGTSREEALRKCEKLQILLCKRNDKTPTCLNFDDSELLNED